MTGQLRVRNWHEFQHYKDRNPPWIKLHFALLASEDWVTLADASKLLAVVCMLIASRNNGMVPNNPAYLKRVAYLDKAPNLKPLIECGFLEKVQADASESKQMLADARPEERRGRDREDYTLPSVEYKKPEKKSGMDAFRAVLAPVMRPEILDDFCTHRKAKKAAFTETAAKMFLTNAKDCGMSPDKAAVTAIDRNWITVKAEWLNKGGGVNGNRAAAPRQQETAFDAYAKIAKMKGWDDGSTGVSGTDEDAELFPETGKLGHSGPIIDV